MAAHLLGQNGHPAGYETTKAILTSGAGLLSESYAGTAMARIPGSAAIPDLVGTMKAGTDRRVREGAVYGLALLGTREILPNVIEAVRGQQVGYSAAASVLDEIGPSESELLEWLHDDDLRVGRMAAYHLHNRQLGVQPVPAPPSPDALQAVRELNFHKGMNTRLLAPWAESSAPPRA